MKHNHKNRGPHRRPASIDGILPSSGRLGSRPPATYHPNRGQQTPSLGDYIPRADGFHPSRNTDEPLGYTTGHGTPSEETEAAQLADETIVLDSDFGAKESGKKSKHPRIKKALKRTALALLLIILITGGYLGFKFNHNLAKVFHGNIFSLFQSTKLKGEDQGRVNILLAGNSVDDPGHSGAELTDSIMLISINTVNNNGYLLSIPRDLWVNYGINNCSAGNRGKINAIYECGQETHFQQNGFPNGGMGLLEKDVDNYFGININYYALVDYSALRDAVNAVGGINFTVNSPDSCGSYNLYDGNLDYNTHKPLVQLSNGTHVLNGEQALDLSRARGDPPYPSCGFERGDFTRTQNQRQMLLSLKNKILSLGTLSNPVKISSLLDVIGNNVQTDFHVDEIKRLYDIMNKIGNKNIQSIGLADSNVNLVKTSDIDGQSVVIPTAGVNNYSQIRAYLNRVSNNDQVAREGANAVVLNGSSTIGLAGTVSTGLTNRGLNVVTVGDATTRPKTTIIALNNNNPATKSYLEKKFNLTVTTDTSSYPQAKNYSADFVIILGEDAANTR